MGENKNSSLISVIVPVYNTAQYLRRCIDSITNQTYKNLEIICVDDGSTDGSGRILDELQKRDSRVKVFHNENKGVSAARNFALNHANGDYIGFVDSDDYISEEYYQYLVSGFADNKVDIVTCGYYFDKEGNVKRAENQKEVPTESIPVREFFMYMYERDTYNGVGAYLWTRLFRRSVLLNNDSTNKVCFQGQYGGADDIVFVALASLQSRNIQYIDKPLYYYFQREGSIVHDDKARLKNLDWVQAYERIISEYENNGISNDVIDIIKRMYVYRCGKLLEAAVKLNDMEKADILRGKINNNLMTYVKTNLEHLERIYWIVGLLLGKTKMEET